MIKILIVGLGIIGGSYAKALRGFPDAEIYGADRNDEVIKKAEKDGVIIKGYKDAADFSEYADVVILCVTPECTVKIINGTPFKKNTLVTDVCGVKGYIFDEIENSDIDYIGGHPMAGKESSGYESSDPELFKNANYIVVPGRNNTAEHKELLNSIIKYIGCKQITVTNPENHDKMIAYTSQLMHIVAAALCDNECLDSSEAYSAGSLRDCTRVAKLDPEMWSELFCENREALAEQIEIFSNSLKTIEKFVKDGDREGIKKYLKNTSDRKRRYLAENKKQ